MLIDKSQEEVRPPYLDGPCLIISGHDFRTPRQVHMHFYARSLAKRRPVRFFSPGLSPLTFFKRDPRGALWRRANVIEHHEGVDCYLWRTLVHPFNMRAVHSDKISSAMFRSYLKHTPDNLTKWAAESSLIIIESGLPVMFYDLVKRANPTARLIYHSSDDLESVGCSKTLRDELDRTIHGYDAIFSVSNGLAKRMAAFGKSYSLPYGGLDKDSFNPDSTTPFGPGQHAVSAGYTLFDPTFFRIATKAFPDVTFHIINGGHKAASLRGANIRHHAEMPFKELLRYFKHASFGIAPYDVKHLDPHFAESSQKLTYFEILGVPAVCPFGATGGRDGRFGYDPSNAETVIKAVKDALAAPHGPIKQVLSWDDVADRLERPDDFPDVHV